MTEDQIERRVETRVDTADRAFVTGRITQEEYDRQIRAIHDWAGAQYAQKRSA